MTKQLTALKQQEVSKLKRGVAISMLDYAIMNENEAVEAWHKVPELAKAFEDMAYGSILKHMKDTLSKEEWSKFLIKIDMMTTMGGVYRPKTNVMYLLEFAGYKEEGGVIETASHYREVKKIAKKIDKEVDEVYSEFEEKPKTAREIREADRNWLSDIRNKESNLLEEFLNVRKDLRVRPFEDKKLKIELPTMSLWKSFFSTVSHCVHPDKGGEEKLQDILNNLNAYMRNEIGKVNHSASNDLLNREFKIWKEGR